MDELLNKKVLVIKNDGFKKFGILREITQSMVKIEFKDGSSEYIPLATISAIKELEGEDNGV